MLTVPTDVFIVFQKCIDCVIWKVWTLTWLCWKLCQRLWWLHSCHQRCGSPCRSLQSSSHSSLFLWLSCLHGRQTSERRSPPLLPMLWPQPYWWTHNVRTNIYERYTDPNRQTELCISQSCKICNFKIKQKIIPLIHCLISAIKT